ncbi:hypothetical protein BAC2_00601 [uncultured bacterium]|nr:hypothetical protein BAC2_00601 [uncultured bacterium]
MATQQGSPSMLNDPVAQELLHSTNIAQLAYNWTDGTPRVIPIWFHWTGEEVVFAGPTAAPKFKAIQGQKVAISINSNTWPYKSLLIRGTARVSIVEGVAQEYAQAASRYFGPEGGESWLNQLGALGIKETGRVAVKPEWVGIHDFETRWPSAVESAMAASQGGG